MVASQSGGVVAMSGGEGVRGDRNKQQLEIYLTTPQSPNRAQRLVLAGNMQYWSTGFPTL